MNTSFLLLAGGLAIGLIWNIVCWLFVPSLFQSEKSKDSLMITMAWIGVMIGFMKIATDLGWIA